MTAAADEELATCVCGSQWFALSGGIMGLPLADHGAVAFTITGSVAAYHGTPFCIECGVDYVPAPQDPALEPTPPTVKWGDLTRKQRLIAIWRLLTTVRNPSEVS